MALDTERKPGAGGSLPAPWQLAADAADYTLDAWQRAVLYADVRRERGNQYRAHLADGTPNVLDFGAEVVLSGADLPRPVNYRLLRILPGAGQATDPTKRPFVVVDPRAGQKPGIGGFKRDSEVGDALAAGHPCYFIGFLPDPVPGQTVEDVMRAEATFVRKVGELHPASAGKPAVIGNCQAGWQVLMTAAVWPELFGPIILAGSPVSYWAGRTPMRYTGGLVGGSWLTAFLGDLGDGRFDGAWLVENFENLDPANTLWNKQYKLYAEVDTEARRYLDFEKWWGGYVYLNDIEIQQIVDDLFIGNRLATAQLVTSDGVRIDLRNIRSPILVFCSYGDNISPPPQALGWITDLYRNDHDLIDHDQTIVYATHDSIGHLGIFVSGKVGRREHREFTNNIELIDMLPAGLFQALVEDSPDRDPRALVHDPYLLSIRPRTLDDVRAIVQPDIASDRRFAAAARVSEINLALYRSLVQPWVRAAVNPRLAEWLQAFQPLRIGFERWSDAHPLAPTVATLAHAARAHRHPVAADNPFLRIQQQWSSLIVQVLDTWRDQRDRMTQVVFDLIYGSPWVQALAGQAADDASPPRPHPGDSPEHLAYIAATDAAARESMAEGGLVEAEVRALAAILAQRDEVDEHLFRAAADLVEAEAGRTSPVPRVRGLVRRQLLLMRIDNDAAMAALPTLLARTGAAQIRAAMDRIRAVVTSTEDVSPTEQATLEQVLAVFAAAASDATPGARPQAAPAARGKRTRRAAAKAARGSRGTSRGRHGGY